MKLYLFLFLSLLAPIWSYAQTSPAVDLVWEANVYLPPFYRGHSQVSPQSGVKVIALANFPNEKTADLTFTWEKDGFNLPAASGQGKDSLIYQAAAVGSNTIKVRVKSPSGEQVDKVLTIPVTSPKIVIYPFRPLVGVSYGETLGTTFNLTEKEIMVLAEPYFFSLSDFNQSLLDFDWQVNNQPVTSSQEGGRALTFVSPNGGRGTANINLRVKNSNKILQQSNGAFKINYGQSLNF